MCRPEWIIFAFRTPGETGQASRLAQCTNTVPTPGQNFVRISLMTDIPDYLVARCLKDIVYGDREFDHTEPGPEMPPRGGDGINGLQTQLVSKLSQLRVGQRAGSAGTVTLSNIGVLRSVIVSFQP